MATPFEEYKKFKYELKQGYDWMDLPKSSSHHNDKFEVSAIHSSIELTRAGQKTAGAKNYWDSPKIFSGYLTIVIAKEIEQLGKQALLLMEKDQNIKAINCRKTIEEIQKDMEE